ncbi:hypothetical protein GQ55_1G182500 [Panicum hallii var. hallii]|uniref:Uncharacterized protein n=1 Tax=Panicum hallii var. hallii TaxID=1504633 RepID=A0A2T7F642_9POAL|nr:hypothetical protein GQ55_1G182500 [Panicum hallii var. hallii]
MLEPYEPLPLRVDPGSSSLWPFPSQIPSPSPTLARFLLESRRLGQRRRPPVRSPPLLADLSPPNCSAALLSPTTKTTNHSIKACRCALSQGPTELREAAALSDSRPRKSRSSLARRSSVFTSPKSKSR